jgi:hypothetical protein
LWIESKGTQREPEKRADSQVDTAVFWDADNALLHSQFGSAALSYVFGTLLVFAVIAQTGAHWLHTGQKRGPTICVRRDGQEERWEPIRATKKNSRFGACYHFPAVALQRRLDD